MRAEHGSGAAWRPAGLCHGRRRSRRSPDAARPMTSRRTSGSVELRGMATSEATIVEAGGRDLRVTSGDRVIFPATERTGRGHQARRRQVLPRGRGRDHARARAAADDARALAEGRAPRHRPVDARAGRRRRVLPEAHPARARRTTCRRRASSSRPAATPTRSARPRSRSSAGRRRWARSRSIRGRCAATTSTIRTSCASTSTRSRAPTSPTRCASRPRRASCSDDLGYAGFPKTSGGRGVHIYVRIEPRWTFTDVRHAAIAFGRELERRLPGEVTTKWWKEERGERIFVDYNQNARDRTIASAYSVRPKPGAPVSAPVTWDELPARCARGLHGRDDARALRRGRRPPRGDRRRRPLAAAAARHVRARRGGRRHAVSARLPEDAGRAEARAAVARPRPAAQRRRSATAPAAASSRRA